MGGGRSCFYRCFVCGVSVESNEGDEEISVFLYARSGREKVPAILIGNFTASLAVSRNGRLWCSNPNC